MAQQYAPGFRAQSPLAAAAQNLIGAFASMPGPYERALKAAQAQRLGTQAESDRAAAELNRAKAAREAALLGAPEGLAGVARGILTPTEQARPDPEAVGPMPQRTREQAVEAAWPDVMRHAAVINPNNPGAVARSFLATVPGLKDTSVIDRAMLGAGDTYASTMGGFREGQDTERWKVLNTPHNVNAGADLTSVARGIIARGRDTESTAKAKIINNLPEDQKAAVLAGKGGIVIRPDGTVEIGAGGLAKPTIAALEKNQLALQDFQDTLATLRDIGSADPTIFGTTGNFRRLWQGVTEQGKNLAHLVGDPETVNQRVGALQRGLQGLGLNPSLLGGELDPNLFNVETMANLAAYQAASALANQEGRSVSDKDVKQFRQIIGDPASWFSSQGAFLAGLTRLDQTVAQRMKRGQQRLAPQGSAAAVGPGSAAPAPAAAAAPNVIRYDAQGNRLK